MAAQNEVEFVYFGLHARIGAMYALEHSGLKYKFNAVDFANDWPSMKPTLAWGTLPVLKNIPSEHSVALGEKEQELGQELAILKYIEAMGPQKMRGANLTEELISNQLVASSEDIFAGLVKIPFKMITTEEAIEWLKKGNPQGLHNILAQREAFIQRSGLANSGKFTSSGCTVGECKMFAALNAVALMGEEFLEDYPGLLAFHTRFASESATQNVLKKGLVQFFAKP